MDLRYSSVGRQAAVAGHGAGNRQAGPAPESPTGQAEKHAFHCKENCRLGKVSAGETGGLVFVFTVVSLAAVWKMGLLGGPGWKQGDQLGGYCNYPNTQQRHRKGFGLHITEP